ncbi:hypothetical protein Ahy_B05g079236 [Arachis hypogaea]|uniref:Uncharacterized protein n=1 Tax=Arachis hypogaea TaxID=3818 RepID=A0A444Z9B1_ARAHY|nr:hypothetical protein Ahy_B05g079236 [Arachis hypogaea]
MQYTTQRNEVTRRKLGGRRQSNTKPFWTEKEKAISAFSLYIQARLSLLCSSPHCICNASHFIVQNSNIPSPESSFKMIIIGVKNLEWP